jgi:large subunit ribosomal protein L5
MARLKDKYVKEWAPALQKQLGVTNKMMIPTIEKIVLNMGFGIVEKDVQQKIIENFGAFSGQRPVLCKARKSISNFKLREGMVIGAKVTLRGERMWEFLDRMINSALPRIRDFRGVPKRGFDHRGNYTLGIKEHSIFPEIVDHGNNAVDVGLDVTFVTTASNDEQARALLNIIGMPFAGR